MSESIALTSLPPHYQLADASRSAGTQRLRCSGLFFKSVTCSGDIGVSYVKSLVAIIAALFASIVFADVNARTDSEIDYLIQFVGNSSCKIERNGKHHDGGDAVAHIQKKYDYFKDDITTAEQFIEYSASKSTMSGKYYLVRCGGSQPLRTRDWLLNALERYREIERI